MSKGKILTTVAAVSVAAMMTVDVYAAGWQHNMTGWWYGTNEANTTWHANGWQWIDGRCYYFESGTNGQGSLYMGGKTPDGYLVNADGLRSDRSKTAGSAPDHGPKDCERFRKYRERTCDEQRGLPAGACFRDRTCVYVPGYGI